MNVGSASVTVDSRLGDLARIRRLCDWAVAAIWLYQGLVPKLFGPHPDEAAMSAAFGIPAHLQAPASYAAGAGEVVLAICILVLRRQRWPHLVSAIGMAVLLLFVAIFVPRFLMGAFNPVVMNGAAIALSVVALIALRAERSQGETKP